MTENFLPPSKTPTPLTPQGFIPPEAYRAPELPPTVPPPEPEKKIKSLASQYREEIVNKLVEIMQTGSHANAVRAAEILAAYSDGKPKQETETVHVVTYQDFLKTVGTREERYTSIADAEIVVSDAVPAIEMKPSSGLAPEAPRAKAPNKPPKKITPKVASWSDVL